MSFVQLYSLWSLAEDIGDGCPDHSWLRPRFQISKQTIWPNPSLVALGRRRHAHRIVGVADQAVVIR
jgi:hypothetical protein